MTRSIDLVPDVWGEAASPAPSIGDLIASMKLPRCTDCGERHDRLGQSKCRACHARYMRNYREKGRELFAMKHCGVIVGLLSEAA